MMKSMRDLLSNRSLIPPLVKGIRASQIISSAENVLQNKFGQEIKDHANPAYYKNGTLTIACVTSTVAQEIRLREGEILAEINKMVPGEIIVKIRYLT